MLKIPDIPAPPTAEGSAGARKRVAEVLRVIRASDPMGSFSAIAEDVRIVSLLSRWPGKDPEKEWKLIVDRLKDLAIAQRCLKCGTCCRVSSPTLYIDDLPAIKEEKIPKKNLFTLRAGELVHSARLKERQVLDQDLIKLRERPSGGCLHLDDHLCSDYDNRPLQCRHLECWSGKHAGDLEERPRLTRQDIYDGDEIALQLIEEYEHKLPMAALNQSLEQAIKGNTKASFKTIEIIETDHRLRAAIEEKYGYSQNELELLLGRESVEIIRGQGISINIDDEDNPIFRKREEDT